MSQFEQRYSQLNPEQKKAVDAIEGPVMVVAGPGSGKTELLSLRVANILRTVDIRPGNILCLTFTDAAAFNMRQRLIGLLGRNAYRVAIHTFHTFGVEVINRYPEYFYNGAIFLPADEVTQTEILGDIFQELEYGNPLRSAHQGQFVYLNPVKKAIEHLKKAGLTPKEFTQIITANKKEAALIDPLIQSILTERVSKKTIPALEGVILELSRIPSEPLRERFKSLKAVVIQSLQDAINEARESDSATPVTEWKRKWTARGDDRMIHLVDVLQEPRVDELARAYQRYMTRMRERGYYDFNDMILDTITMLENNVGARLDLQDRYQYLLVDEFQDTNDAQMRLIHLLTDNQDHKGRPNIMVVGDDDQAIYKFQGAEISNILQFRATFRDVTLVALKQNYRSTADILTAARHIIKKGVNRLEKDLYAANKRLKDGAIHSKEFPSREAEYQWVVGEVGQLIANGVPMKEIALISREHRLLEAIAPYFHAARIPIAYERQQNVLEERHILQLITMLRFVDSLMKKSKSADDLLPEILNYPFWGLERAIVWELSVKAHQNHTPWLTTMRASGGKLKDIADFFIALGAKAAYATAEEILHELIGQFRSFYFSKEIFDRHRAVYLMFLSSLQSFVNALRKYHRGKRVSTHDTVSFVDMHASNKIPLSNASPFVNAQDAVQLMSAHKAKGLEFEAVFVINCQEDIWTGRGSRGQLILPSNLPIAPARDTLDDQLRVFYVAITRAKRLLYLTSYHFDHRGKESDRLGFIAPDDNAPSSFRPKSINLSDMNMTAESLLSQAWDARHAAPFVADEKALLKPMLESYQLSVTHLQNFLNVADAGPWTFIEKNLLMFPEPKSPSGVFGSAFHGVIQQIYEKLKRTQTLPELGEVNDWFAYFLKDGRLNERETELLAKRGLKALEVFYPARRDSFSAQDRIELNFRNQGVVIGDAHLTGKIDRLSMETAVADKKIIVHDFKTGKAIVSWEPSDPYEKIKAWKYRQQLAFYKLLVERSRDFGGAYQVERGIIEFVEPVRGQLINLTLDIDPIHVERLKRLIEAVYKRIINLDFPDISKYPKDISGILQFEEDCISSPP